MTGRPRRESPSDGLTSPEAERRLRAAGPNEIAAAGGRAAKVWATLGTIVNPLSLVLLVAGGVSAAVGEYASAIIIVLVVSVSAALQVWQTARSDRAMRALRAKVAVTATVRPGWAPASTVIGTRIGPATVSAASRYQNRRVPGSKRSPAISSVSISVAFVMRTPVDRTKGAREVSPAPPLRPT